MLAIKANAVVTAPVCPFPASLQSQNGTNLSACSAVQQLVNPVIFHFGQHPVRLIKPFYISYFASKECTYTDASGRPVPAPRSTRPERAPGSNTRRRSLESSRHHPPVQEGSTRVQSYNAESSSSQTPLEDSEQGTSDTRKRCRYDDDDTPSPDPSPEPAPPFNPQIPVSRLDPYIVRELVNRE